MLRYVVGIEGLISSMEKRWRVMVFWIVGLTVGGGDVGMWVIGSPKFLDGLWGGVEGIFVFAFAGMYL